MEQEQPITNICGDIEKIPGYGKQGGEGDNRAIEALQKRDLTLAHQIISMTPRSMSNGSASEDKCIELIATQQPMASDLRIIVAVLSIVTELERIGDYAEGMPRL